MKTEVKKIDTNKRELSVELNDNTVKDKFEDVFKAIAKEAKVPGFRPGHAPRDVLEKHYASAAHQEVLKELIPDIYHKAVEKEGLDTIELPEIFDVKLDRNSLSFKAKVEVRPQIKIDNYKGLKVRYKKISVSSDEIKRNIDSLKESKKIDSLDHHFARRLGFPDLEALEQAVERQIFLQKENEQRQKIENQIVEDITKGLDFKVPESLVSRQLQDLLRQSKLDLALKGMPRENIDSQEKTLLEALKPQASKQAGVDIICPFITPRCLLNHHRY